MNLTLQPLEKDNLIRVRCDGHLSSPHIHSDADPLERLLGPVCYSHRVILNLERVRSIDTGGVCWLLKLDKKFRASRGRFVLHNVPGIVLDVLDVLKLVPLLNIATDEADAVARAAQSADEPRMDHVNRDSVAGDGTLRRGS